MTITEFLLARIAKDEAAATEVLNISDFGETREWRWVRFHGPAGRPSLPSSSSFYRGAPSPVRVLAECEAKRRIIIEHAANPYRVDPCDAHDADGRTVPCATLLALAAVYADHPDCREEWRP